MGSVLAADDLATDASNKPYWALGMSETLGPYSYGDELRAPGYPLCAPMDHIADRYEVRIADENDQPVADGEIGEIQVRGYAVTPGLHKIERDDYLHRRRLLPHRRHVPGRGQPHPFVGRDGDMIKTAGSNVSPAEVEMEMQQLGRRPLRLCRRPARQGARPVGGRRRGPARGRDARFRGDRGGAAQAAVRATRCRAPM